jgi:single-stranded DNA-binding protein
MPLNKFLIIGTLEDSPIRLETTRQGTNATKKVKIKVNVSETDAQTNRNIINVFCFDQTAEYCLTNLITNDLLYVEGYIKRNTNWNNQAETQLISKFVKKISNKQTNTNATTKDRVARCLYEYRHLAHKID